MKSMRNGEQTSQVHVVRIALKPVRELYGHTKAVDFGPLALTAVRARLVRGGVSRSTANSLVSRMRQMFRWAAADEMLPASIHQALTADAGLKKGRTTAREADPVKPVHDSMVEAVRPYVTPRSGR